MSNRALARLASLALVGAAFLLYVATAQRALFDDGIHYVRAIEAGTLAGRHLIYLPLLAAFRLVAEPFHSLSAEAALKLLSAVAGAGGVALALSIAKEILGCWRQATVTAALVAVLSGYWWAATATEVHALNSLCASILLLGLVRAVGPVAGESRGHRWWTFTGAALTPASHTSGVAALLPTLVAVLGARRDRLGTFLSAASGFACFGVAFVLLSNLDDQLSDKAASYSTMPLRVFARADLAWAAVRQALSEALLYSTPVSTLMPLGFLILVRRSQAMAAVLATWFLGWFLVSVSIPVDAHGSYLVPTFAAQATLAVVALRCFSASWVTTLVATGIASIPAIAFAVGGAGPGLATIAASAAALFLLPRREPPAEVAWRRMLAAPVVTLALTAIVHGPSMDHDPIRDSMHSLEDMTSDTALILLIDTKIVNGYQWERYFDQPDGTRTLNFLLPVDMAPATEAELMLAGLRRRIERRLSNEREVYLVGSTDLPRAAKRTLTFLAELGDRYQLLPRERAGELPVLEIRLK